MPHLQADIVIHSRSQDVFQCRQLAACHGYIGILGMIELMCALRLLADKRENTIFQCVFHFRHMPHYLFLLYPMTPCFCNPQSEKLSFALAPYTTVSSFSFVSRSSRQIPHSRKVFSSIGGTSVKSYRITAIAFLAGIAYSNQKFQGQPL